MSGPAGLPRGAGVFVGVLIALMGRFAFGEPAQAKVSTAARKPNIVVVMTDDWTVRISRFMPNFRVLQRSGTTFSNFMVSYSLCAPSRATFLTGQYAHNNGVRGNFRQVGGGYYDFRGQNNTLPVWLQHAGYRTAFVGKYVNEYGARSLTQVPPGWNDFHGLLDYSTYNYFNWAINENGVVHYHGDRHYANDLIQLNRDGVAGRIHSIATTIFYGHQIFQPFDYFGLQRQQDYGPDVTGRIANAALGRLARGRKPFFLYYAPIASHDESDFERLGGLRGGPTQPDPRPPARYARTYDSVGLPHDPSINQANVSAMPANVRIRPRLTPAVFALIKRKERGRLGAARAADDSVGRLIRTLRRDGKLANTIFIYTSDQGYLQGQHRIPDNKYFAYEPSIRTPLVISGPGFRRGATDTQNVYNQDLAPTLAAGAGAIPGRVEDGVSLLPALHGRRLAPRDLALEALAPASSFKIGNPIFDLQVPYYGVRTARYKYIKWSFGDEELYDLKKDPHELRNLAALPAYKHLKARLAARARALRTCRGASCWGSTSSSGTIRR